MNYGCSTVILYQHYFLCSYSFENHTRSCAIKDTLAQTKISKFESVFLNVNGNMLFNILQSFVIYYGTTRCKSSQTLKK